MMDAEFLKYPVGKFDLESALGQNDLKKWIGHISSFPGKIKSILEGNDPEKLNNPYRPGGWTGKQVIHHCADSHMNAFIRIKLALTENQPTILPYDQDAWADLSDSQNLPAEVSLNLLTGLHDRWVEILNSLDNKGFERTYRHPAHVHQIFTIKEATALYSWHCRHHLAHIKLALEAAG